MIYALKLLVTVLVAGGLCALLARRAFATLMTAREYQRAWKTLLVATVVAFMGHSPIGFVVLTAVVVLVARPAFGTDARGSLALFALLAPALPPVAWSIGGVGDINRLFEVGPQRLLGLLVLLPLTLRLTGGRHPGKGDPFHFGFDVPGWKLWVGIILVGAGAALVLFSKEETEGHKPPAKSQPHAVAVTPAPHASSETSP